MATMQEAHYTAAIDYRRGSPHLSHHSLNDQLVERLRRLLTSVAAAGLPLRVLEVGAGHGGFTEPALAMGCEVTAVDMSKPSVAELRRRWGTNAGLETIHDPEGDLSVVERDNYSVLLCVAVLHHIPDYLAFLQNAVTHLRPGGALLAMQDPLWYPRNRRAHRIDQAAYFSWRLAQGDLGRGIQTRIRRLRGVYQLNDPADMVEYHVVRQGVDDESVLTFASNAFASAQRWPYWSSQPHWGQVLGERLRLANVFGIDAQGYKG